MTVLTQTLSERPVSPNAYKIDFSVNPFTGSVAGLSVIILNFHAVVMSAARSFGFKIDFVRNTFSGLAARFFVIILKLIFILISDIKIY